MTMPTDRTGDLPRVREGYFPVPGAELYFGEAGSGSPLVILHGGPDLNHNYLLPGFGSTFERISPDLLRSARARQVFARSRLRRSHHRLRSRRPRQAQRVLRARYDLSTGPLMGRHSDDGVCNKPVRSRLSLSISSGDADWFLGFVRPGVSPNPDAS